MLELFKGQLSLDDIRYNLSYKEAIALRDSRIRRLEARESMRAAKGGPSMSELVENLESQM